MAANEKRGEPGDGSEDQEAVYAVDEQNPPVRAIAKQYRQGAPQSWSCLRTRASRRGGASHEHRKDGGKYEAGQADTHERRTPAVSLAEPASKRESRGYPQTVADHEPAGCGRPPLT